MPDVTIHAAFGREVRAALPEEVRGVLADTPYTFAQFGPDIWFMYRPWKLREGRGRHMHTTRPGAFLMALADRAKAGRSRELFSYLAGFLCHYALDSTTHPYIIHITTERHPLPRSHMSFEHSLDILELRRAGVWGEKHPVTGHFFPALRLPESLRADLDAAYMEVYGWKHCWKALNRSWSRYRLCYRVIENPKSLFSRLARATKHPLLKSIAYSESHFNDMDVENAAGTEWLHSHDPSVRSSAGFDELRAQAQALAVDLITAAYRYVFLSEVTREELEKTIGNRSYLSGLPADDPRNHSVASLLPPRNPSK